MSEEEVDTEEVPFEYEDEFNLDEDYVPVPIIPPGPYNANIVKVILNAEMGAIVFSTQLQGNPNATCSDGATPVDGQQVTMRLWLPKPGDETTMTKSGKQTKRQWKLNTIKETLDKMGISAPTISEIKRQVEAGEWNRDGVSVDVAVNTYKGQISNDVTAINV